MHCFHRQTEAELLAEMQRTLRARRSAIMPLDSAGSRSPAQKAADAQRGVRSLQTCHRSAIIEHPMKGETPDTGAYVPEMAARIEDDRDLTDGARRCARKLAELTYRANRSGRSLDVTVTYLMKALGRGRRTVQRYLRSLERAGYIGVDVVRGARSRMCVGLVVHLLGPLFPRHHRDRWPENRGNPDAPPESQNHRFKHSDRRSRGTVPCHEWALRCMDGVFRSLMKTLPPLPGDFFAAR